jgi:hypothetical protein
MVYYSKRSQKDFVRIFVNSYKRNRRTIWYFIYDITPNGDILIKKIMNNYLTQK